MSYTRTHWVTSETALSATNMNNIEDGIEEAIAATSSENLKEKLVDIFYPVGSYYETSDTTFNPNTAWGGTWTLLGEGQVLISGSTEGNYKVNTQYGSNTKTLSVGNIPAHTHTLSNHTHGTGDSSHTSFNIQNTAIMSRRNVGSSGKGYQWTTDSTSSYTAVDARSATSGPSNNTSGSTGSGTAFNVMQLSTAACIWHRTA